MAVLALRRLNLKLDWATQWSKFKVILSYIVTLCTHMHTCTQTHQQFSLRALDQERLSGPLMSHWKMKWKQNCESENLQSLKDLLFWGWSSWSHYKVHIALHMGKANFVGSGPSRLLVLSEFVFFQAKEAAPTWLATSVSVENLGLLELSRKAEVFPPHPSSFEDGLLVEDTLSPNAAEFLC